jgi:hypothetical protein
MIQHFQVVRAVAKKINGNSGASFSDLRRSNGVNAISGAIFLIIALISRL